MDNCNCRNQYYRTRMQNSCQNNIGRNRSDWNNSSSQSGSICTMNGVDTMPLAMAYVPWQHWKETYEPCKGLGMGTIFPELNLPFLERSCGK